MPAPRHLLLALKSPLQAINAIEYCRSTHAPPATSVTAVLFTPRPQPEAVHDLAIDLLKSAVPGVVVHVGHGVPRPRPWWHRLGEYQRARRFLERVEGFLATAPRPTELLVGDFRSRECRHLAGVAAGPDTQIVLLDDGSATHQIARYRHSPTAPELAPMFPVDDSRTRRLRRWGIQLPGIEHSRFFTHYDIVCPPGDQVVRHAYPYWRSQIAHHAAPATGDVLFLGMSHVEKRLTDLDRYLAALRAVKAHYGDRPVRYRPHRDELPEKLAHVEQLGFLLSPSPIPVELLLLQAAELPAEVSSIASSAMDNLAILFGAHIRLRCFVPPDNYCNSAFRGHFSDILRYHQSHHRGNLATTPV